MSGVKTRTTTIAVDELERLRRQVAAQTDLRQANTLLNQMNQRTVAAVRASEQRVEAMQRAMNSLNQTVSRQREAVNAEVQGLRTALTRTIRETDSRIAEEASRNVERMRTMRQQFLDEIQETRQDVADAMAANNRRIERAITENGRRLRAEMEGMEERLETGMQDLRSQIDAVEASLRESEDNRQTLTQMAQEYLTHAREVIADTAANYRTELLVPGMRQQTEERAGSAEREIEDAVKMPENAATARREAREAFEAALRFRQEVLRAEQEWNQRFVAASESVAFAQAQLENSRLIELSEEDTGEMGETAGECDVDHWSDGDLSELDERLRGLQEQLKEPDALSLEDLDAVRDAGLQVSRETDETALFALEAFYSSQERGEIAQDIFDELESMGLTAVDYGYQDEGAGEDAEEERRLGRGHRGAHRLHLRNEATQFEIIITQRPEVGEDGHVRNQLESHILDYGTTDEERAEQIRRDIYGMLEGASGIAFTTERLGAVPGYETRASDHTELRDMERFRSEERARMKPVHREGAPVPEKRTA